MDSYVKTPQYWNAIQWVGDNSDSVRSFLASRQLDLFQPLAPGADWLVVTNSHLQVTHPLTVGSWIVATPPDPSMTMPSDFVVTYDDGGKPFGYDQVVP